MKMLLYHTVQDNCITKMLLMYLGFGNVFTVSNMQCIVCHAQQTVDVVMQPANDIILVTGRVQNNKAKNGYIGHCE